jgi:hypothetical protein
MRRLICLLAAGIGLALFPAVSRASWTPVLNDQFSTPGAVPPEWHLYSGPYGSGAENCADPSQAYVSGGYLHMLLSYRPDLPACGGAGHPQTHWYSAGMMIDRAYGGYDQAIKLRWRVIDTDPSLVSAHRIIPMRIFDTGTWPDSGEEDWCEGGLDGVMNDGMPGAPGCQAFFHPPAGCLFALINCSTDYPIDETQWHTTEVERITAPSGRVTVRIYVDNFTTPLVQATTTTADMPDTFKRTALQQECQASCPPGTSPFTDNSEAIEVDWIKVFNRT